MIWVAGVCAVCFGICLPLFMYYKKSLHLHLASAYKSLGTLCSFILVLIAAIKLDPHCYILAAGMIFYAVADYIIEFHFMLGAGFFLFGHICSIAYFLILSPFSLSHLIAVLLFGGTMAYVFYRWRKSIGSQMSSFIVYGVSLVLMSGCAVSCFSLGSASGILISCGGAMFCLSDFLLLRRLLFPSDRLLSWAVMISYYASLLLFGTACILF